MDENDLKTVFIGVLIVVLPVVGSCIVAALKLLKAEILLRLDAILEQNELRDKRAEYLVKVAQKMDKSNVVRLERRRAKNADLSKVPRADVYLSQPEGEPLQERRQNDT